jgi:hypothetical protein
MIHKMLKVDADTKLVLSPTNNRHVLWDELKLGKAIFASKNQSELVRKSLEEFRSAISAMPPPANRTQSYNEIKSLVLNHFGKIAQEGKVTSKDFKKIEDRIRGPISNKIKELYPKDKTLVPILDAFLSGIRPGSQILVKRLAHNPSEGDEAKQYLDPEERQFPMAKKPDDPKFRPGTKEKIFHQEYIAWFFDGDRLIDKKYYSVNGITVYRDLFAGWADINFYVIENEKFQKAKTHPFVSTPENQFTKIIPIDQGNIKSFVDNTLKTYGKLIIDKMKANAAAMQQAGGMEEDYAKAEAAINAGIRFINPIDLFKEFILNDIKHQLSDYMIIKSDVPFDPNAPWSNKNTATQRGNMAVPSEDWTELDKGEAIAEIQNKMRSDIRVKAAERITVRPKNNRAKIISTNTEIMGARPDVDQYEMFDSNQKLWVPFDANYIKSYKTNYGNDGIAIAFPTADSVTDFTRKFALYAMHNIVKAPEAKQLEDIMDMI